MKPRDVDIDVSVFDSPIVRYDTSVPMPRHRTIWISIALFVLSLVGSGCLLPTIDDGGDDEDAGYGRFEADGREGRFEPDGGSGTHDRNDRSDRSNGDDERTPPREWSDEKIFKRRLVATHSYLRQGLQRAKKQTKGTHRDTSIAPFTEQLGRSSFIDFSGSLDVEPTENGLRRYRYDLHAVFDDCRRSGVRMEGELDYTATFIKERDGDGWVAIGMIFETTGRMDYYGLDERTTCRYELTVGNRRGEARVEGSACGRGSVEIRRVLGIE